MANRLRPVAVTETKEERMQAGGRSRKCTLPILKIGCLEMIQAENSTRRIVYKVLIVPLQMLPERLGRSKCIEQQCLFLGCIMKSLSSTVKRAVLATATACSILAMPAVAQAATVVGPPATVSPCTNFTFSVAIISCAGGYSGNLLQGTALTDATAIAAVVALGSASGTYLEPKLENLSNNNPNSIINFNTPLSGLTIFGMHVGGAGDPNGQGTFFFSFNAQPGTDVINVTGRTGANGSGLSNAALFKTSVGAVPEPSTWMLMLLGMAGVGFTMRRKDKQTLRVRYT